MQILPQKRYGSSSESELAVKKSQVLLEMDKDQEAFEPNVNKKLAAGDTLVTLHLLVTDLFRRSSRVFER